MIITTGLANELYEAAKTIMNNAMLGGTGICTCLEADMEAIRGVSAKIREEDRQQRELESFRQDAKLVHEEEGTCEIDDEAVVSLSEDNEGVAGAYVAAWVYVEKEAPEGDD